tara:strand:+ start:1866 stop:2234 length:369 start_codon:yes stop_codon:yes gene_type:complete
MNYKMTGTLVKIMPVQSGQGAKGEWKRQTFVINTGDEYPKDVAFEIFKVDQLSGLGEGQQVEVEFNLSSREYNDKWYTQTNAWRVKALGAAPIAVAPPMNVSAATTGYATGPASTDNNDLPF